MGQTLARFVAFHEASESEYAAVAQPSFSVALARSAQGVVLVLNRYRNVWELPGGLIDPGESPRECAARELVEESGCTARNLAWLGLVEVEDGRTHFGAVFSCDVDAVPDSFSNDEIVAIATCTPGNWPQPLGNGDAAILNRFG